MNIECVVDSKSELGEGAVWDAQDQCLWWVDIMGELVHRFDPVTGEDKTWPVGEPVGCLAVRQAGGLILATKTDTTTGEPSNKRVFFDTNGMNGRPDGGTVDADGCYWYAGVGGWEVVRITPEGKVDQVIEVPVEKPTKPMFGGKDLDVLYVTSLSQGLSPDREQPQAGSLFAITGHGALGVPEARFAG